jgi:GNAT superfamily N-acetyltransferase
MAAKRGKQFPYTYKHFTIPADESEWNAIEAHHPDEGKVGHLLWHPNGEIQDVQVDEPHRRKGVATGMLEHAKTLKVKPPKHSELRTEEGDAWVQSLGDTDDSR